MDLEDALLPNIIDFRAQTEPERLYCAYVKSVDPVYNVVEVTYAKMANAINRLAWFIQESVNASSTFETLAYVGPSDVRFPIFAFAAAKTGHKAQFISPINPEQVQTYLLGETACTKLFIASDYIAIMPAMDDVLKKRPMQKILLHPLDHWLQEDIVNIYQFPAKLSDNYERPFVVLHTSGSTGMPKPITYRFSALQAYKNYLTPEEQVPDASRTIVDVWKNCAMYMSFPAFHMVGTLSTTALPIYWNMPFIMGPVGVPLSADIAVRMVQIPLCQSAVLPPSVLHEIARNPEHLRAFEKLSHIIWCGAPFASPDVAERIRAVVNIYPAYGSTEIGPLPLTIEDQSEHEWMSFNPIIGATFRPVSDDIFELVIKKDTRIKKTQFVFLNWPEIDEWPTKDLMSKHPTKDMWRYRGRKDDCIVLSTGNNIIPMLQEGILMQHPLVTGALLTGTGRETVAWLIETKTPPTNEQEKEDLLKVIWPQVELAHKSGQTPAIAKNGAVVFTTPEKPMLRATKGSIQRNATVLDYRTELAAVYDR